MAKDFITSQEYHWTDTLILMNKTHHIIQKLKPNVLVIAYMVCYMPKIIDFDPGWDRVLQISHFSGVGESFEDDQGSCRIFMQKTLT